MKKKLLGTKLLGTFVFAMTMTLSVMGKPVDVKASSVDIDYSVADESLSVTAGKNTEIMYRLVTTKVNLGRTVAKETDWTVVPVVDSKAEIDISTFNYLKDNIIQVKGNSDQDIATVKIPAQSKFVSAVADKETGKVTVKVGNSKRDAVQVYAGGDIEIQYRTANGGWKAYTEDMNMNKYQLTGATLYFRTVDLSATQTGNIITSSGEPLSEDKMGGRPIEGKTFPARYGKQAKVRIPKRGNAPKATVDYAKNQVTIPKGTSYRFWGRNESGNITQTEWTPVSGKTVLTLTEEQLSYNGALELKTSAVAGKKPESKIRQVPIKAQEVVELNNKYKEGILFDFADKTEYIIGSSSSEDGYVTLNTTLSDDNKCTIVINNSTNRKFNVILKFSDHTVITKTINAKGTKATKPVNVTLKNISLTGIDIDVYIQEVGLKAKYPNEVSTWTSKETRIGKLVNH